MRDLQTWREAGLLGRRDSQRSDWSSSATNSAYFLFTPRCDPYWKGFGSQNEPLRPSGNSAQPLNVQAGKNCARGKRTTLIRVPVCYITCRPTAPTAYVWEVLTSNPNGFQITRHLGSWQSP